MDNQATDNSARRPEFAHDEPGAAFALLVEFSNQAPILLELEGRDSTCEAIHARLRTMGPRAIRWQIVRITPTDTGNELLFHDFLRLQRREGGAA